MTNFNPRPTFDSSIQNIYELTFEFRFEKEGIMSYIEYHQNKAPTNKSALSISCLCILYLKEWWNWNILIKFDSFLHFPLLLEGIIKNVKPLWIHLSSTYFNKKAIQKYLFIQQYSYSVFNIFMPFTDVLLWPWKSINAYLCKV